MRIIKHLSDQIKEESEGAMEYAKDALKYKDKDPELADLYHELAQVEYTHVQKLHDQVVRKINDISNAPDVEPPEYMVMLWEDIHEELMECMAKASGLIEMYKKR